MDSTDAQRAFALHADLTQQPILPVPDCLLGGSHLQLQHQRPTLVCLISLSCLQIFRHSNHRLCSCFIHQGRASLVVTSTVLLHVLCVVLQCSCRKPAPNIVQTDEATLSNYRQNADLAISGMYLPVNVTAVLHSRCIVALKLKAEAMGASSKLPRVHHFVGAILISTRHI